MLLFLKGLILRIIGRTPLPSKVIDSTGIERNAQNLSFSQCGEDVICKHLFLGLGIEQVNYLDLGAYHPMRISNTYLFYQAGSRGVNVEPNPDAYADFLKYRPEDINLNVGVGTSEGTFDYYTFEAPTLNTFSKKEAQDYAQQGYPILSKKNLQVVDLNSILAEHFTERPLDLLSMDVEGLDFDLLSVMELEKYKAKVICVEAVQFSRDGRGEKDTQIKKLLESRGYLLYADTGINYIFVRREFWDK